MIVNDEYGEVGFTCDYCSNEILRDAGMFSDRKEAFSETVEEAKQEGWKFKPIGSGEWEHACPVCAGVDSPENEFGKVE